MLKVEIWGSASGKLIKVLHLSRDNLAPHLLHQLSYAEIPVASSCRGEGLCEKCIVRGAKGAALSCRLKTLEEIKEFIGEGHKISISYL